MSIISQSFGLGIRAVRAARPYFESAIRDVEFGARRIRRRFSRVEDGGTTVSAAEVTSLLKLNNIYTGIPTANINVLKKAIDSYKSDPKKLAEIRKILHESKTPEERLNKLNDFFKLNKSEGWKETVLITKDSPKPTNPKMWADIKADLFYVMIDEHGNAVTMQFDAKMLFAARNPEKGDQSLEIIRAFYQALCSAATSGKHIKTVSGKGGSFLEIRPLGIFGNKRLLGRKQTDGTYLFEKWKILDHKEVNKVITGQRQW